MNKSRKTAKAKLAKADVKHGAVAAAGQPSLLTAAQIENDCPALVQDLGKRIAAHYDKLVKCEEKAEQHRVAIGQLLVQAKGACDEGGFTAFRERFCPKLGKTRAHELLQIASGKKTIEDVRAATARRMKKHRAAKKTTVQQQPKPSVTVTDPDPAVIAEKQQAAVEQKPKPSVTVTDQDPAVTAEKRKAEYSDPPKANDGAVAEPEAEPEAEPTVAEREAEPTVEEAEAEVKRLKAQRATLKTSINANMEDGTKIDPKASANALAEFNGACSTCLPQMSENDLQAAIYGFAEIVEVPAKELMPDLRQLQHELKIAKAEVTALKRKLAGKLPPRESRADAWGRHYAEACSSIEALISMQQEFEEARDAQPDSLREAPFAQKCDAICAIDLESALSTLQEAESAEVPLGFGRD